ncbi:MAG: hypothetical protein KatS3mg095_0269 [Candidatus Parcubacteria bacterium]|nr:MAG: hypothetical protein KatS3mg095_0269 [Candidatus Parcubacteria bacterium]
MKAMTLIEILISLLIIGFIIITLFFFTINISNFNTYFVFNLGKHQEIISTANIMSRELKSMLQSNVGNYPIEKATNNEIVFYSDIDNDGLVERIRYFIENNNLKKGIVKPQGNPLSYDLNQEKILTLIYNLTNSNIFEYYDKNNQLTFDINNIKIIKINLSAVEPINNHYINHSFIIAPRNLRYK